MIKNKKIINLEGQVFGRLTVIELDESTLNNKHKKWVCKCSCGKTKSIRGDALKSGKTKSCGCIAKEKSAERCLKLKSKNNIYQINDEISFIIFENGGKIVFDTEDYDILKPYYWRITNDGYAKTNYKNKKTIQMHRLILSAKSNEIIDHIKEYDGIPRTLNNTKKNLRIATPTQNSINRTICKNNTSGVTGVSWSKSKKMWRAYIKLHRHYYHLGYFKNKNEAIKTRKTAEEKYFGEWSYDNSTL